MIRVTAKFLLVALATYGLFAGLTALETRVLRPIRILAAAERIENGQLTLDDHRRLFGYEGVAWGSREASE